MLATLIDRRLVTAAEDTVEVAHEALLREWPRLRGWLEDDREGRRLHRQLTDAAAAWQADGRDDAGLYRGVRLHAARDWAAAHPGDANPLEDRLPDRPPKPSQNQTLRTPCAPPAASRPRSGPGRRCSSPLWPPGSLAVTATLCRPPPSAAGRCQPAGHPSRAPCPTTSVTSRCCSARRPTNCRPRTRALGACSPRWCRPHRGWIG